MTNQIMQELVYIATYGCHMNERDSKEVQRVPFYL